MTQEQVDGFKLTVGSPALAQDREQFPILFPNASTIAGRSALFGYIENHLVRMAEEGTLSVTALHNQPAGIQDIAGMIILGQRFEEGSNKMVNQPNLIPLQLQNYRVKVRALTDKGVGWKQGRIPGKTISNTAGSAQLFQDAHITSGMKEAELSLAQAWICLHQAGKNCVPAKSIRQRASKWLYEEVMPERRPTPVDGDEVEPENIAPHLRKRSR